MHAQPGQRSSRRGDCGAASTLLFSSRSRGAPWTLSCIPTAEASVLGLLHCTSTGETTRPAGLQREWAPEDSGSGSLKLRSNTSPLRLLSGHSPCIYPQVQPLPQRCSLGWPSRASFWISQHCKPQSWGSCLLGAFSTLHHPSSTLQLSAPALCLIHPCFRYEVGSC